MTHIDDMGAVAADVLPHDRAAEQSVLGALMQLPADRAADVIDGLTSADFYDPRHGLVFAAITALRAEASPVDTVTVLTRLREQGDLSRVGGGPYLHDLIAATPTVASAGHYAEIIRGHAWRRRMCAHAAMIRQQVTSGVDLAEARDRIDADYTATLATATTTTPVETVSDWWDGFFSEALDTDRARYLSTGLPDLDRQLGGGIASGQLVIIAGRPGAGKTVLMAQIARQIAQDRDALFVALEQPRGEILERLLAAEGRIPLSVVRSRPWTDATTARVLPVAGRLPMDRLAIESIASGLSPQVSDICQLIRRHHRERGIGIAVVDYVQLVETAERHQSREQEVAAISRRFRTLSIELGIPIVLGAQFNRGPESRVDKRPVVSDLRESGSLEQDADVVILMHHHGEDTDPRRGEVDLIVGKNRAGATGDVVAIAQYHMSRIASAARDT